MELRVKGVYLENLAMAFGVSSKTLSRYIRMAEQEGFEFWSQR
jgi:predicted DNA binding protein